MERKVNTIKMQRQRKLLLALPVLVFPFVTLMFWALGGGNTQSVKANEGDVKGFNLQLPDAKLAAEKDMGKMDYYNQAQSDSAKFSELVKNDPAYLQNLELGNTDIYGYPSSETRGINTSLYGGGQYNDPTSERIYQKLAELDRANRPMPSGGGFDNYSPYGGRSETSADVQRLDQMMKAMSQPAGEDPEMKQLNTMLENIMEIQNPGLAQEKMRMASEAKRGQVFTVNSYVKSNPIMLLEENKPKSEQANGFFSLENQSPNNQQPNAIQAVIHENQTVESGSTVKLRLVNDIFINGVHIPKDNFIFGEASLSGERLTINIKSVRYINSIFPVELVVYDVDGIDGLYIPGAIGRDVAKQSADRSVQTIGIGPLDQTWGAQAAGAGIEAAKTLFSKKVKVIRVTVKAGYQVLLRDEKQKQNVSNQ